MKERVSKPLIIFAAGLTACAGVSSYIWYSGRREPVLEVYVFNTPGKPLVFIRTPDDHRILIGGGANADIVRRLTSLIPFYSRRLDLVIAPDTDPKNVTGLIEVMNRYTVDRVMIPAVTLSTLGLASSSDPTYDIFLEAIRERTIPVQEYMAGNEFVFGAVKGTVLFPAAPEHFKYSKASGPTLCMNISFGKHTILLMGDTTTKIQKFVATQSSTTPGIFPASVLAVFHSLAPGNIADDLMKIANLDNIIYSQAIPKNEPKRPPTNAPKKKADPVAGILYDHRFNIRNSEEVRVMSDGQTLTIL